MKKMDEADVIRVEVKTRRGKNETKKIGENHTKK